MLSTWLEVKLQTPDIVSSTGDMLRSNEAVNMLGNLHGREMLEIDFMKPEHLEEVLHFGMNCRVAEDTFFDNQLEHGPHQLICIIVVPILRSGRTSRQSNQGTWQSQQD